MAIDTLVTDNISQFFKQTKTHVQPEPADLLICLSLFICYHPIITHRHWGVQFRETSESALHFLGILHLSSYRMCTRTHIHADANRLKAIRVGLPSEPDINANKNYNKHHPLTEQISLLSHLLTQWVRRTFHKFKASLSV